ncbi:MAG: ribosome silencing factor [Clostridiales bacterium]|jgi:ribosome-associated protein|nr:ribosome silencing factor [Clostridiales bacterium]
MTPEQLKNKICGFLDDKKAVDISVLNVGELTVLADYFIVAGGTSTTNVKALAEYVEEKIEELGELPLRKEGLRDARWVVYDYGSVILHILLDDMRLFYCLEKLWSNGKNIEKYSVSELAAPVKKTASKSVVKTETAGAEKPAKKASAKKTTDTDTEKKTAPKKIVVKTTVPKKASVKTAAPKKAVASKSDSDEEAAEPKIAAPKKTTVKRVIAKKSDKE